MLLITGVASDGLCFEHIFVNGRNSADRAHVLYAYDENPTVKEMIDFYVYETLIYQPQLADNNGRANWSRLTTVFMYQDMGSNFFNRNGGRNYSKNELNQLLKSMHGFILPPAQIDGAPVLVMPRAHAAVQFDRSTGAVLDSYVWNNKQEWKVLKQRLK